MYVCDSYLCLPFSRDELNVAGNTADLDLLEERTRGGRGQPFLVVHFIVEKGYKDRSMLRWEADRCTGRKKRVVAREEGEPRQMM